MPRTVLLTIAASLLLTAGVAASVALAGNGPPSEPPGQGECEHGNSGKECKPDPQPEHGKDCDEHGPYEGGVNEDHCLPETTTTTTTTTPTTTVPTTTTPPVTTTETTTTQTRCPFVGADKDGGHDAYGGTNDDCAPFPPKTTTTPAAPPPTVTVQQATATSTPAAAQPAAKPKPKPKPPVVITKTTDSTGKPIIVKKNKKTGEVQIARPGKPFQPAAAGSG